MAEACFLAVTAMVQLLIQLEYVCMCVCVFGREHCKLLVGLGGIKSYETD